MTVSETASAPAIRLRGQGFFGPRTLIGIFFRRRPLGVVGLSIILLLIVTAIFAPRLAPYDPIEQNYADSVQAPGFQHIFGTDNLGRDLFSRVIWGAVISTQVVLAVPVALLIAVPFGLLAAHLRGPVDTVIMRIADAMMTIPTIFLALVLLAAIGPGIGNVILAIAIADVPRLTRLVRAQALTIAGLDYVTAAKALGVSDLRIMFLHIWPNSLDPIIVQGLLLTGAAILLEAGLSFLGVGIQPPTPSWGSMIKVGYQFLQVAPWVPISAGVAIFITVLGFNFVGDAIRDTLDPRLQKV